MTRDKNGRALNKGYDVNDWFLRGMSVKTEG